MTFRPKCKSDFHIRSFMSFSFAHAHKRGFVLEIPADIGKAELVTPQSVFKFCSEAFLDEVRTNMPHYEEFSFNRWISGKVFIPGRMESEEVSKPLDGGLVYKVGTLLTMEEIRDVIDKKPGHDENLENIDHFKRALETNNDAPRVYRVESGKIRVSFSGNPIIELSDFYGMLERVN